MSTGWTDLLDPTAAELHAALPPSVSATKIEHLLEEPRTTRALRPRLEVADHHLEGVLIAATRNDGGLVMQEVHVIATTDALITICKTPRGGDPFDTSPLHAHRDTGGRIRAGTALLRLFDEIAEDYLDLVEVFDTEIDRLEDEVESLSSAEVRARLSALRHDVLHVRRTLGPTRDAARLVLDGRLDLPGRALFPREVELQFADVYDKLLRAVDALDLSRDLIAGVRDFHQAQIAHDQNEVMKRLAAVASLLLVPTFIVGLYGQNFADMPELRWGHGYLFSWGLIVASTVAQLWWFRRNKWL